MKTLHISILVGLLFLLIACSTISVNYDYDRGADFTVLRTYDWLPIPPEAGVDGITVKRIINAVDAGLEAKGFTRTSEAPDFLIAAYGEKVTKVQVRDRGYDYGRYRYRGYPGLEDRRIDVYQYEEGTLILDFVDAHKSELIWRGSASAVIDPYASPEKRERQISEAVEKMLGNFPPAQNR